MRILFIADGRSPTALNWIGRVIALNKHDVHLASTYPAQPKLALASLHITPVAFNEQAGDGIANNPTSKNNLIKQLSTAGMRTNIRRWLAPLTFGKAQAHLQTVIDQVQPDLIHALRIPYEGMLATLPQRTTPLIVSVWGNDFTLHAPATPLMRYHTKRTLKKIDALTADCQRDLNLATDWGLSPGTPIALFPGAGGIDTSVFKLGTQANKPTIINPRGLRAYVRNDTFFKAITIVAAERPDIQIFCPSMENQPEALNWVEKLNLTSYVKLLPRQTQAEMVSLFQQSQIAVSPSEHDGTPNSLLEAMACGCFPIAGDIESVREWVTTEENGILIDPNNPQDLASAILRALADNDFRKQAQTYNLALINQRAAEDSVMAAVDQFYTQIVRSN